MKRSGYAAIGAFVIAICLGPATMADVWAQAFGMISATVERTDDARGLTVRAEPSASAPAVGFLPVGTEVKSCADFKDDWVRLETPSKANWVNMAYLKPKGGDATVAAVDKPDLCLAIRKGPYSSYEKTGCAELGQKLKLSGVWSTTNWARLEDGGWVDASKIETDLLVCEAPLAAARPAEVPAPVPPAEAPAEPYVPSDYAACPPYGVASGPLCYAGPGAPFFYGDFGAFGYFPGVFPFVSIGVGPWRGYYHHRHHHHRGPYYDRRHGYVGRNAAYHRGITRGAIGAAGFNRRAASVNTTVRNFGTRVNRSAARTFRPVRTGTSFARSSYPAAAFRSLGGSGFRSASFSRGRGMSAASFSRRSFGMSSFRGGSFRGASFRGGAFRGGGHRR